MIIRQPSNKLYRSLIPLAVGTFVLGTDLFVLTGMLPLIADDLHVSVATAGQLTTLFAWTYAIASPVIAAAAGSIDRRWLLGGGAALFVVGMIGQAAAATFAIMAAARIVAAIGAAAFQANAFAVAGAVADDARRGRALAVVASGITVSAVAGVPIGIFMERWVGWRGVLWVIAVAGVVAAALVPLIPRVTLPSAGLRERAGVLLRPPVLRVLLVTTTATAATFTTFAYLPVVVEPAVTQNLLAWLLLAMGIGQVAGTALTGHFVDRYGPRPTLTIALLGTGAGLLVLTPATERTWCGVRRTRGDGTVRRHDHGSPAVPPVRHRPRRAHRRPRPQWFGHLPGQRHRLSARRRLARNGRQFAVAVGFGCHRRDRPRRNARHPHD
ncbi:MFS transporter [Nocardia salmonicida]|uniref:MFS transporter n=1 Tax=Nocardia salmonicida TaxID=53431 RepID=UPI0037B81471